MTPGSNRVGVLQTSTAKLDLKEPYYRMTQSPAYAWSQQEQQQQQVTSLLLH
jgi:histone-arginine methyltransferase CARM1